MNDVKSTPIDLKALFIIPNQMHFSYKFDISLYKIGFYLLIRADGVDLPNTSFLMVIGRFEDFNDRYFFKNLFEWVEIDEENGIFIRENLGSLDQSGKISFSGTFLPEKIEVQRTFKKKNKPLLSKKLFKEIPLEDRCAIIIQRTYRMLLAKEKYFLMKMLKFRRSKYILQGKGGKILNHIPYFLTVHKAPFHYFLKAKNLQTNQLYCKSFSPSNYIFGFGQINS